MILHKKTKKRTPSRFVQASFQSRVKRASGYRRNSQGLLRDMQVLRALVARVRIWPLVLAAVVATLLGVLVYYPPLLHIQRVDVSGLPAHWSYEAQQQAERYLADRRFLVLPGRHMAFVDMEGLKEYLTTVNAHVERVEAVVRHWPHVLEVRALPRVPAYDWSADRTGVPVLISNDGKVLPDAERGVAAPLRVYGSSLATDRVGGQALTGDLLKALEMVRTQFSGRTGLGPVTAVRLVPLVAASPTPAASERIVPTLPVPPVRVPVTHELWVEVPADQHTRRSDFVVLLDMTTAIPDALDRLRVLLEKQPEERLAELVYVDMRFPSRAYICVRSAACAATGLQAAVPETGGAVIVE